MRMYTKVSIRTWSGHQDANSEGPTKAQVWHYLPEQSAATLGPEQSAR